MRDLTFYPELSDAIGADNPEIEDSDYWDALLNCRHCGMDGRPGDEWCWCCNR